ncbi:MULTISPECIES: serine/threonine-protein kinase [Tsukamurella]|uniref:non-specific serine/threonine protein kinase n=2 Tax=Tsukamurella TaxID=2060 RepID=A0A5C5S8W5_9ACTN|nr:MULTISPECIES: serine/threonine-protein kinase [Tsukamurella]NMD58183.1 protein kinase [Tsukamurella columbiensis]TWS30801.1 protein kinase [Tsukamurella conjunctivitidis]
MSMQAGAEFAGFRVVRRLGAGGMGEVYLVAHPRLPREEALKILPQDLSTDESYRVRFNREADLAATLFHPNIVGVHDRGESDGKLWLSMDYVAGVDLDQLIRDRHPRGLPVADVVSVITQVASALDHAHGKGLIHRDVKPANILLAESGADASGRVLLADFGIARRMDDDAGLTATNTAVGTVTYAAPEQLADEAVDGRTDQYALAATALTLLTGRSPFAGTTPGAVISRKMRGEVPRAAEADPRLAPLDRALATGMAADPNRRFRTCTDFARALEAQARQVGSGPMPRTTQAPAPGYPPARPTAQTPPPYGQATQIRPSAPVPHYDSQPSFPAVASAPIPAKRPWQAITAAIVLIVVSVFGVLLGATNLSNPEVGAALSVLWLVCSAAGFVGAVALFATRTRTAVIVATAAAVILGPTCFGLIATVAVPILLWLPTPVRAWYSA